MSRVRDFLRKSSPTLRELLVGILLWGVVLSVTTVWFADPRIPFLLSLWAGDLAAAGMAVHMYIRIEDSLELPSDDAVKHMRKGTALRLAAAMLLFVLAWRLRGSVVGIFLGLITLKLGAYTQPAVHKVLNKK